MDWRAKTLIPGLSTTIKIYYLGQAISLFEHYSARFDWEDGASRWRATRREQKLDCTRDGADTHARMHSAADRYLVSLSNVREWPWFLIFRSPSRIRILLSSRFENTLFEMNKNNTINFDEWDVIQTICFY